MDESYALVGTTMKVENLVLQFVYKEYLVLIVGIVRLPHMNLLVLSTNFNIIMEVLHNIR